MRVLINRQVLIGDAVHAPEDVVELPDVVAKRLVAGGDACPALEAPAVEPEPVPASEPEPAPQAPAVEPEPEPEPAPALEAVEPEPAPAPKPGRRTREGA